MYRYGGHHKNVYQLITNTTPIITNIIRSTKITNTRYTQIVVNPNIRPKKQNTRTINSSKKYTTRNHSMNIIQQKE